MPRSLTDPGAVALAVAVAAGAWWHRPVPLLAGVALAVVALVARRPALLVLGGLLLASALGARSWAGMAPVAPGPYEGRVTLVGDPQPTPFGVRVDVRAGDRRLELQAADGPAGNLVDALAGERFVVRGRLRPPPPRAPWLVPRHVVGRLVVDRVDPLDGGAAPWRAANRFRRLLGRGAEVLPEPTRSLYGGFVLGDERGQPPEVVDDFRGSGLSHLMVVSGQNVAFVLVLVSPLSSRLRLGGRWAVTVGVILAFAVLTRFEPSVLRASAMAAVSVTAALAGRPAGTVRVLALAVTGLVLVDPLLVHAVGFQLSVAASLGIALLAAPVAGHLRGPAGLREALAVTVAAQLAVAPLLVPRSGGLPVVAVVANVLAVPVAGLVTTWGLPAGVVAGLAGPPVAGWVHLPTQVLIGWVAGVARVSASLPLGSLGTRHLVVGVAAAWAVARLARHLPSWRAARAAGVAMAAVAALAPAVVLRSPPPVVALAGVGRLHRAGGATVLVVDGRVSARHLLEALRGAGVRRLDVVAGTRPLGADVLAALRHRWPIGRVLATGDLPAPLTVQVGPLVVDAAPGAAPVVSRAPG